MKKPQIFITLLVCLIVAAFATPAAAQKTGGYKEISKTDDGAKAAAEFAVSERAEKTGGTAKLVSIQKAERQVVAGMNYRLCLEVITSGKEGEADVPEQVKIVVYRNLKNEYSLTSWVKEECAPEEDEDS